jgi:hypothetical protein
MEDARSYAEAAANIAEEAREPAYLCTALRLRARLRAVDGDLEQSRTDLERARSIARDLELGPELAKCHYNLAK